MSNSTPLQNNFGVKPLQPVNKSPKLIMMAGLVIVLLGLVVGYVIASRSTKRVGPSEPGNSTTVSQTEAGAKDASSFKDTATGTLVSGGIKGEGTYHLDRPGGATKTVYLTSTVIDMGSFVGKKVQVWGQTQASKYAPWFMDVGKIKVVE